jgi:hypothetical protein
VTQGCEIRRPPEGAPCQNGVEFIIHWHDGDRCRACRDCALYIRQLAEEEHKTMLKFERLPQAPASR